MSWDGPGINHNPETIDIPGWPRSESLPKTYLRFSGFPEYLEANARLMS
jgi:hypothetical protein